MTINKLYPILLALWGILFFASCSDDGDVAMPVGDGIVYGTIVDGQTNEPLQGASVTLYPGGRTVVTGGAGQYEFRSLSPGGYLLQVAKGNYLSNAQTIAIAQATPTAQADIALVPGDPCLDVLVGELFFGGGAVKKTFVVSNVGQRVMQWSLFTDYDAVLSFSVSSGSLEPGQSQAVEVTMDRAVTTADLTSFPIYVYSAGEELGVIATINRESAGRLDSPLVGEWGRVYMEFLNDGAIWNNEYEGDSNILNIRSDYVVEWYNHEILAGDTEELDDMFNYLYESYEYDYDAAKGILVFDPDMGFDGNIYRINTLTDKVLEIETVELVGTPAWRRIMYERR